MTRSKISIFWFRRDLRLEDNHGLFEALSADFPVQPIFIFDRNILDKLNDKKDARVHFLHQELHRLQQVLQEHGTTLDVRIGTPKQVWKQLLEDYDIGRVYANKDYEPYARERDKAIYDLLSEYGITFKAKKDHVIFEKSEVVKADGKPYTVYTPYSKQWKLKLTAEQIQEYPSVSTQNWHKTPAKAIPELSSFGFQASDIPIPDRVPDLKVIGKYHETRDIPAIKGTSRIGLHLRFGTTSLRALVRQTKDVNEKFLNELIWRDFYQTILWHFPAVVDHNFSRKYDGIEWRNDEKEFQQWCDGNTGYPIVDAGMRELNATGFMHNRVRMIVASFLTKHLLIHWSWGEAYFAEKLLDFELASNNGGWQWAAGTGVDAAPYFRVFNPYIQTEKFDPKLNYVRRWVPEFQSLDYPKPIVDHKLARERAISTYKQGLGT
ncbi:MAG: deoxyribodipyrimidine photo-lyase [Cytophagales bacterium]|nr:deoxyribodipyrimidine photo-lyase [Cytophagales bacterium]